MVERLPGRDVDRYRQARDDGVLRDERAAVMFAIEKFRGGLVRGLRAGNKFEMEAITKALIDLRDDEIAHRFPTSQPRVSWPHSTHH